MGTGHITKQALILEYVSTKTLEAIKNDTLSNTTIDALSTSLDLEMDRANASKLLNILWREGRLVKIMERPVMFFDYQSIVLAYKIDFLPLVFPKLNDFVDLLKTQILEEPSDLVGLDQLIGSVGSLTEAIIKAKASINYPPIGINTLISGSEGVGKTEFAFRMVSELKSSSTINKELLQIINCLNYTSDTAAFARLLLGTSKEDRSSRSQKGVFELNNTGIIVLENIDALPFESLELLNTSLQNKVFNRLGDSKLIPLQAMIIATSNDSHENNTVSRASSAFPTHIKLLDLDQRGIYEKVELILYLFSQEAKEINQPIEVNKTIIISLASIQYPRNITQLRSEIRSTCARANLDSVNTEKQYITIDYHNLSTDILSKPNETSGDKMKSILFLNSFPEDNIVFNSDGSSKIYKYIQAQNRSFIEINSNNAFSQFIASDYDFDMAHEFVQTNLESIAKLSAMQVEDLKKSINPFIYQTLKSNLLQSAYHKDILDYTYLMSGILLHLSNQITRLKSKNSAPEHPPLVNTIAEEHPQDYRVAAKITQSLERSFNIKFSESDISFLTTYLLIGGQIINSMCPSILVICHGNSIASEFVSIVKPLVDNKLQFAAIDFNDTMQLNDCLELACIKSSEINNGAGVIVATDLPNLNSIAAYVSKETHIRTNHVEGISLQKLIVLAEQTQLSHNANSFDSSALTNDPFDSEAFNNEKQENYIIEVVNQIIKKSVVFIDVNKAVQSLMKSLYETLDLLNITYHDAIAVKYLCHSVSMLERVITNRAFKYANLSSYISKNKKTMYAVESALNATSSTFGIKIPSDEIAYISEIFTEL